jgi:DNA invertase Pin-like site-specific DNA recombinase
MLEAVIYTRNSKVQGARSVAEQEQECRAWAERSGHSVRLVFSDKISASRFSTKARPEWIACKKALREGDILVVWEASRAHRDMEEFVELRNLCASKNVPLFYSGKFFDLTLGDDRFTAGLDALLAERESEQTSLRILRAKRTAAAEGRPAGKPPWGYRQKVDKETGLPVKGAWEVDPVEAPRVKEAVRRYINGQSMRAILAWLQETEGWSPATMTSLSRALKRPSIAGLRAHRGEVVRKGVWQPLITEEEREQVLRRMQATKRVYGSLAPRGPEPKHLLSGIAVCGICGAGLQHKTFSGRSPAYICPNAHVCRAAELLDRAVEDDLLELAAKRINPKEYTTEDPAARVAAEEIEKIEGELDEYAEMAGRGDISPKMVAVIERQLRARIAALQPKTVGTGARRSMVDFETLQKRWPQSTVRQRREAIRMLFSVTVMPHGRGKDREPETCIHCGASDRIVYARSLCRPCYQRAHRGKIEMPPYRDPSVGRVVIERLV